jgi:predicted Rossmann fold flavoprotein
MDSPTFDVAVIGGGPAGMMAAGRAAESGARVILIEKNAGLGKKLLITGGGRCNIFNAEYDTHRLVEKYGAKGKSLFSAFSQFDAQATRAFFESHGLPIKVEAENRAFPVSERANDVHQTMLAYMKAGDVEVRTYEPVMGLEAVDDRVTRILVDGGEVVAKNYIVATGGKSRPETGSTGDGFVWMRELGHTVIDPDPALVPITLKDAWIDDVEGISLKDVKLSLFAEEKRHASRIGKMLFTHDGISGPLVLNMSKQAGELLKSGPVTLSLDLFPELDHATLDAKILAQFDEGKNKLIKNNIGDIVQPRLGFILLKLAGIDEATPLYRLTKEERRAFVKILKDIPLHMSGLLGPDKAIVTGGGVSLKEIEFKTMRSKLYENLYLAGDILDFDRPSGGFSLQICWTTGFIAGGSAASSISTR